MEREELGAGAHLCPDRVRLVGVDHADEVHVEIHEAGYDGGVWDAGAGQPSRRARRRDHTVHAAIPDHQRHVSPGVSSGSVPKAAGHDKEVVHRDVVLQWVVGRSV